MKKLLRFACAVLSMLPLAAHAAAPLPAEVEVNGVEFVLIPAGKVWVPVPHLDPKTGLNLENGMRELQFATKSFYIAKYEARARDFLRFMSEGKPVHAAHYDAKDPEDDDSGSLGGCSVRRGANGFTLVAPDRDLPATHLSWDLANEFSTWMGFRMPTEIEWVRAFRGDDKRRYPWGDEYPDDTYASFQEGATSCNVQPVDAFAKGASPFGVRNMAGNIYEYVADWENVEHYNSLKGGETNPVARAPHEVPGDPGKFRVLRGGRWASGPAALSIYGNRTRRLPSSPFRCYGVRFALDTTTVERHLAAGTARTR
ncbi:formylglycine-generating enzyme family protein [Aromatoleum evansii]|uniref:formylglycine-generating enzyme family protein n=1 Tax=Aromatoleum evansii TaxID=59406 RepID=UPI00145F5A48|nr:formylglycine-generating enzyme family protein [Aromatoleum evansii]NMG31974.1 SUMF1/EgtB/PvdO family nonheme iron enzyme [Aromatoleum evansii]